MKRKKVIKKLKNRIIALECLLSIPEFLTTNATVGMQARVEAYEYAIELLEKLHW